ncbi:MAG TPA: hemolysin III family protein [Solirubrobacteraceae bacterium]
MQYVLPDGLPRPLLRGWLHLGAFVVALALGIALVIAADGGSAVASAAVYAFGVCGLFGASALYHRGRWQPRVRALLQRIDHSMIFVLIAGTYTPVCVLVLPDTLGTVMLAIIWGGAAVGVFLQLLPRPTPRAIGVVLYIALGWVAALATPTLLDRLGWTPTLMIGLGGVLYTAGAVVYARKRPDPVPHVFGYHEVFHAFTLVAAALHYAVIAFWVY